MLHNAESDYGSAGHYGWVMNLNFVLRGALSLAVVAAIRLVTPMTRRLRAGLVALAIWAVASGLLAAFPDDPGGVTQHGSGRVHIVLALIAFPAVLVGATLTSSALRRLSIWQPVARSLTGIAWFALVPLILMLHAGLRGHELGALYEKVFLAAELAWFLATTVYIARTSRTQPVSSRAAGSAR